MILIFILFAFAYFFLITHFVSGWRSLPEQELESEECFIYLTLVIPFRNEENNLPVLLDKLAVQTHTRFQLILIDDHSTDNSFSLANSFLSRFDDAQLLKASGIGKKQALKQAVAQAKGDLIVCTDADCVPGADWLKSIAQFQSKEPCDLILGPLKMKEGDSIFSRLQVLEFSSLIACAAGSAAIKMPVLANAANMAFTPRLWSRAQACLVYSEASGDDMFLLHQAKKEGFEIRFLKSKAAMLELEPSGSLSSFINQRKRWAGKSKSYTDWQTLLVGFVVFGISICLLVCLVLAFIYPWFWKVLLLLWMLKLFVDAALLYRVSNFFGIRSLLKHMPLLSLFYPFYVSVAVVGGIFGTVKWKGRLV